MPLSTLAASVVTKGAGSLAVVPLVLTSATITSYARYAAHHHPVAASENEQREEAQHQAELLHQHVVAPWKGTR